MRRWLPCLLLLCACGKPPPAAPRTPEPIGPARPATDAGARAVRFVRLRVEVGKEAVDLEREGGGWRITAPISTRADAASVERLASALERATLKPQPDVTRGDADLGLAPPRFAVTAWPDSGVAWLLVGGAEDPFDGSVWVRRGASDPRLYTLAGGDAQALSQSLLQLRDRSLLPLETATIRRVEVHGPRGDFVLARVDLTDWERMDARMCEWAIRTLTGQRFLTLQEPVPFEPSLRLRFAGEQGPLGVLELAPASGGQPSLGRWQGTDGEVRFGRVQPRAEWPWVEGPAVFRDRRLFRFEPASVARLELRKAGASTLLLKRRSDGTFEAGRSRFEAEKVHSLLQLLDGLRTSAYRPGTPPSLPRSVELWSTGGESLGRLEFDDASGGEGARTLGRMRGIPELVELESSRMAMVAGAMDALQISTSTKR